MLSALILSKWTQVRSDLATTIEKFAGEELAYRPFAGAYSAAELMLHIAHEEAIEVWYAVVEAIGELPAPYDAVQFSTRESILAVLRDTHQPTVEYLRDRTDDELLTAIELPWGGTSRPIDMLWHVLEHEIHHRGELSLLLGLLGRQGLDA